MSDIMDNITAFGEEMSKLYRKRQEAISKRRSDAQNHPLVKARKSRAMKEHWRKKKEKAKQDEEDRLEAENYVHESCYCSTTPFPPCGFCESANYCEDCEITTMDEECPKCGSDIER